MAVLYVSRAKFLPHVSALEAAVMALSIGQPASAGESQYYSLQG